MRTPRRCDEDTSQNDRVLRKYRVLFLEDPQSAWIRGHGGARPAPPGGQGSTRESQFVRTTMDVAAGDSIGTGIGRAISRLGRWNPVSGLTLLDAAASGRYASTPRADTSYADRPGAEFSTSSAIFTASPINSR